MFSRVVDPVTTTGAGFAAGFATGCGSQGSSSTLTVAAPASQNGDFVEGFGSNAYDRWATNLMH
ncbi:hypothetical protein PT111_09045, partial [Erysipelothrix rhusiopathiae]|nr:hypothetical protein [Erysipelothrix rhusiopathiae]